MKRIGIGLVAAGFVVAVASAASAQSTRGTTNSTIGSGTPKATVTTGMEHSTANRAATTGTTTHGASAMAPGHLKKQGTSARNVAPGRSTTKPPGQTMTR